MLDFTIVPTIKSDSLGRRIYTFFCPNCGKNIYHSPLCDGQPEEDYAEAQRQASTRFNHCPDCGKWVCDSCFAISDKGDLCIDCAKKHGAKGVIIGDDAPHSEATFDYSKRNEQE